MTITTSVDRLVDPAAGTGSVTVAVDAPAEQVFALVSDLSRMGQWSPECVGVEGPTERMGVGSAFVGRNRRDGNEWTTSCTVVAWEPGALLAFFAGDEETGTTWTYRVRPQGDGRCELTESFDSRRLRHPEWQPMLAGRAEQLVDDMADTVAAVKRAAEAVAVDDGDG
ncbi:MAG: SRPBCC family protein [Actinomycetota bacterium]|nr:SRPBCC family protein [Actinomycetota bacterium]MDH5278667.1 SRPBCC family protein [Actinomycetota bacterium]